MLVGAATIFAAVVILCAVLWYAFWVLGKALDENESRFPVQYLDGEDSTTVSNIPHSLNAQIIYHFAWLPGSSTLGHASKY
jgi:hypothetical protein